MWENDRQAGTVGGNGGPELAEKAAVDLGLNGGNGSGAGYSTKARSNTLDEKQATPPFTRIGRTATGTQISRHVKTGGRDAANVTTYGMIPIVRQPSIPPAVGPFGGAAPTGVDAEEGLYAVRSHEEELERQKTMDKKGPDPFAVRFVPGDKENPKVCPAPPLTCPWNRPLMRTELGHQVPLVAHHAGRATCPELDLCFVRPIRRSHGLASSVRVQS